MAASETENPNKFDKTSSRWDRWNQKYHTSRVDELSLFEIIFLKVLVEFKLWKYIRQLSRIIRFINSPAFADLLYQDVLERLDMMREWSLSEENQVKFFSELNTNDQIKFLHNTQLETEMFLFQPTREMFGDPHGNAASHRPYGGIGDKRLPNYKFIRISILQAILMGILIDVLAIVAHQSPAISVLKKNAFLEVAYSMIGLWLLLVFAGVYCSRNWKTMRDYFFWHSINEVGSKLSALRKFKIPKA